MRKKILIAEKSEAIRSIAESLLHQHGYDVISAGTIERAKQLIISSEPSMIIVGADLKDSQEIHLYEIIAENEATSKIPMLLIADPDGRQIPFPPEIILPRPFETEEFMEKVRLFVGGTEPQKPKTDEVDPFNVASVDDEFLDAALGLDHLQVEDSEVVGETTTGMSARGHSRESEDDFGIARKEAEHSEDDSSRVESLMIREDGFTEDSRESKQKIPENLSASSKLEIPNDPYGMKKKQTGKIEQVGHKGSPGSTGPHDYDWFINEMQKDVSDIKFAPEAKTPKISDEDTLHKEDTGAGLEPIKQVQGKQKDPGHTPTPEGEDAEINAGGVDEFISEFRKEMENLNELDKKKKAQAGLQKARTASEKTTASKSEEEKSHPKEAWEDQSQLSKEELRQLTDKLIDSVSEKLAAQLLQKLDKDELFRALQQALPDVIAKSRK